MQAKQGILNTDKSGALDQQSDDLVLKVIGIPKIVFE